MVKNLRKRHRQIWMALALVLPAIIITAWLVIPDPQPVKVIAGNEEILLPDVIRSAGTPLSQVNIRSSNGRTVWQLEWKSKKILEVPSAVIYASDSERFDPANAIFIGRIESKGRYLFSLEKSTASKQRLQLVLYDFIHGKVVDIIKF